MLESRSGSEKLPNIFSWKALRWKELIGKLQPCFVQYGEKLATTEQCHRLRFSRRSYFGFLPSLSSVSATPIVLALSRISLNPLVPAKAKSYSTITSPCLILIFGVG